MKSIAKFFNGRYHNNFAHQKHGVSDALQWLWSDRKKYKNFEPVHFTKASNNPEFLKTNTQQPSLTWIGHATFLIQIAGLNVLTDPVFADRTSPFRTVGPKRLAPLGLNLQQLPTIDLVLISHNHYDHLDAQSVRWIAKHNPEVTFIVPTGVKKWFTQRNIRNVFELNWWQSHTHQAAKITAVPAQHFSGRGLHDRDATLWCGFVLEVAHQKIYFAGDTGYSQDFKNIGAVFSPIDLALLPIGAYAPRSFMQPMHIDPEEAVKIFIDIGAKQAAAMHWGTFRLTTEPLNEPPIKLKEALIAAQISTDAFYVMQHGETRLFNDDLALNTTQKFA